MRGRLTSSLLWASFGLVSWLEHCSHRWWVCIVNILTFLLLLRCDEREEFDGPQMILPDVEAAKHLQTSRSGGNQSINQFLLGKDRIPAAKSAASENRPVSCRGHDAARESRPLIGHRSGPSMWSCFLDDEEDDAGQRTLLMPGNSDFIEGNTLDEEKFVTSLD